MGWPSLIPFLSSLLTSLGCFSLKEEGGRLWNGTGSSSSREAVEGRVWGKMGWTGPDGSWNMYEFLESVPTTAGPRAAFGNF